MGFMDDLKAVSAEEKAKRNRTPEQKAADRGAKKEGKKDLRSWRMAHPAELHLNAAGTARPWPSSERGVTKHGEVAGAKAEFVNDDAHKAWTATRLVGGVATLGASAALTGRKNKGHAAINLVFPNGAVQSYTVKPDAHTLKAANQYVTAFNALSVQLVGEIR